MCDGSIAEMGKIGGEFGEGNQRIPFGHNWF